MSHLIVEFKKEPLIYGYLGLIAAGIGLLFNHDYWYLFPIPMTIGGFILYCDFKIKREIIKYVDEQMKPIDELKDKIIDDIEKQSKPGVEHE